MEEALLVALIVSNIVWLYFWHRAEDRNYKERFTLLERIQRPDFTPSPPYEVVQEVQAEGPEYEAPDDLKEFNAIGQEATISRG